MFGFFLDLSPQQQRCSAAKEVVFSLMLFALFDSQDVKSIWAENNQFHYKKEFKRIEFFLLISLFSVTALFPSSLQGIEIFSATSGGYPLITLRLVGWLGSDNMIFIKVVLFVVNDCHLIPGDPLLWCCQLPFPPRFSIDQFWMTWNM